MYIIYESRYSELKHDDVYFVGVCKCSSITKMKMISRRLPR